MTVQKSGNKQILVTVCAVAATLVLWEAAKVLPGKIDVALQERYSTVVEPQETVFANAPPVVLTQNRERLYGLMKGREAAINRETPIMVNQMLKLNSVHYSPSAKTMSHHYEILSDQFLHVDHRTVVNGLKSRYCASDEFEELKVNQVAAKFIYWDSGARKFEYTVNGCY